MFGVSFPPQSRMWLRAERFESEPSHEGIPHRKIKRTCGTSRVYVWSTVDNGRDLDLPKGLGSKSSTCEPVSCCFLGSVPTKYPDDAAHLPHRFVPSFASLKLTLTDLLH